MQIHHLRVIVFFIIGLSVSSCSNNSAPTNRTISLDTGWALINDQLPVDSVDFPFSLIETLYKTQHIEDPNYEDDHQDISIIPASYWLKKEIQIDPNDLEEKQIRLNPGNINGKADILINDKVVYTSESYYLKQEILLNSHLNPGINIITIQFKNYPDQRSHPNFQQGNKQNFAHVNLGCANGFKITESSDVFFKKPYIGYSAYKENVLEAFWNIPVQAEREQTIVLEWTFNGKTYKEEKTVKKGQSLQTIYFPIENPNYWVPYTEGTPFMYSGNLRISRDNTPVQDMSLEFGVKHLKWINNGNQIEFVLNGTSIDVFAIDYNKTNWYTWTTPQETKTYINHLKGLGINCVRVSGKDNYLQEDILNMFDKAGIFVWQDLHFTRIPKAWSAEVRLSIQQEMLSLAQTYRNHPSVLSLGGKTENHNDTTENAGLIHYEIFEQVVPEIINTFSDLEYIPNATFVWNDVPNNFDALSMSSFEFLDVWLREKNKDPYENAWISKMPSEAVAHNYYDYLFRMMGEPIDIESMIYYSELHQNAYIDSLLAIKRGLNPHTIHIPVSYGESGPGIHPSITDYFGYRKALFYTLLKLNQPLNIRKSKTDGVLSYLLHNNTDKTVNEQVNILIRDKSGNIVDELSQNVSLRPNQEKSILDCNVNLIPALWKQKDNRCLEFQFGNKKERFLLQFNDAPIPYPDFKYRVINQTNQQALEVLSNSFIPYSKIKTSHLGYFSTNFVTLLPQDTLHIPFNSEDKTYPLSVEDVEIFNYYQSFE